MVLSEAVKIENYLKENYKFRKVGLPEVFTTREFKGELVTYAISDPYAFNIEIYIGKKWRGLTNKDLNKLIKEVIKEFNLKIEIKKKLMLTLIKLNSVSGKEILSVKT